MRTATRFTKEAGKKDRKKGKENRKAFCFQEKISPRSENLRKCRLIFLFSVHASQRRKNEWGMKAWHLDVLYFAVFHESIYTYSKHDLTDNVVDFDDYTHGL